MMNSSIMESVKKTIGIAKTITTYDAEIRLWVDDACRTMTKTAGVPEKLIKEEDPRAVAAIIFYVKANYGNDREDSEKYMRLFKKRVRELQMEEGGIYDDVEQVN